MILTNSELLTFGEVFSLDFRSFFLVICNIFPTAKIGLILILDIKE